jgi:DNA replication initiation complex subunit (GINS family)
MGEEITITFETLFDLLRREKSREELQKLSDTFLDDVKRYIEEKAQVQNTMNVFSEQEQTRRQLENVRRILRELYERREKKILMLAINKSRTGSNVIDTRALLPEEQQLYADLVSVLDFSRNRILVDVLAPPHTADRPVAEAQKRPEPKPMLPELQNPLVTLRFLQPVPSFMGENLETIGPFEEEEIASLPRAIASVLVERGRAEEVRDGQAQPAESP